MKIINTKFKDLKIIKHNSFKDKRGFLRVTHNQKK
jgi:dTDP-4-dehydrorhamnose 3,5-epimerase-like enzyme